MNSKYKILIAVFVILLVITLAVSGYFSLTPSGHKVLNTWKASLQKADDATDYETLKMVEDTCRAMIASYNSDKLVYEQYKDNTDDEKQEWAEQAKMRANKTASTYNNYILKNKYVWKDNIPSDIYTNLGYID